MVVVMAKALPLASTMLMCDVPYSGCANIGAKLLRSPRTGLPTGTCCMLVGRMSLARVCK